MNRPPGAENSMAASAISPPTLSQNLWPAHKRRACNAADYVHIDRPLFLEYRARVGGFVVERDVSADGLHELDLFVGTGRGNYLQPCLFRELDYDSVSRLNSAERIKAQWHTHEPTAPGIIWFRMGSSVLEMNDYLPQW